MDDTEINTTDTNETETEGKEIVFKVPVRLPKP